MKRIEILIAPNGQSTVETKGFTGGECRDASQFIETALGKAVNERMTSEFHKSQAQQQSQQQKQ